MKDKILLLRKLKQAGFPEKIIKAFKEVEREDFVIKEYKHLAYQNQPLPIGFGQTISQPQTIAFMLYLLELGKNQKILEVGSGSGYVLALLAQIAKDADIYGAEVVEQLADRSKAALSKIKNIKVFHTPSSIGLPEHGPFDRILVSAAADKASQELFSQLANGGILVCPIKNSIVKMAKIDNTIEKLGEFPGFVFVPLIKDE